MQTLSILAGQGARRVLCLGAHADDIEIGCGGTILRLAAERRDLEVRWMVFASNPVRAAEARASAGAFLEGVKSTVVVRDYRDGYLPWAGAAIKDEFEALKREFVPDLIFTHQRDDLHQDHRLISELTWNTWRNHLVLEYEIPKYEGDLGLPSLYVPIDAATARRKIDVLLRSFPSQAGRSWFRAETFEAMLRLRGIECNAAEGFAEAFHATKWVI